MALRRNYRNLNRLNSGASGQLKKGHEEKMVAGLTERQMIKAIRGGFYSGDPEGFADDMRILRNRGTSIRDYYNQLKKGKYI